LLEKYPGKVKVVMKQFPLRNHRFARSAAEAALAADLQGRFREFSEGLFDNMRSMSEETILATAEELGLDLKRFESDRRSARIRNTINRDLAEGNRIGVRGTPSIFVNGKRHDQRSMEAFSAVIERELASGKGITQ
jgi:protein-disulfide isomerase